MKTGFFGGHENKMGQNDKPTVPKPAIRPPAQRPPLHKPIAKKRLVEVIEPTEKDGLYKVMFDYGNGVILPSYMNEYSYKVFLLEIELREQGATAEVIEDFKQAVSAETDYDRDMGEGN